MDSDSYLKYEQKPYILKEKYFMTFLDFYKICTKGVYKELKRLIRLGNLTKELKREKGKNFEDMKELDKLLTAFDEVCEVLDEVLNGSDRS